MYPDTIFITNASEGLGFDLIRHILSQPHPPRLLFAGCTPSPEAMKCLEHMASEFSSLRIVPLDITNDNSIECAFAQLNYEVGDEDGLNLLINNAGVIDPTISGASLTEQNRQIMSRHFETNAVAPLVITKMFLPVLKEAAAKRKNYSLGAGRAAIINMSFMFHSIKTSSATLQSYHYRAARAALNTITNLMAMELKELGILVAAMQPGWADMGGSEESGEEEKLNAIKKTWSTITSLGSDSAGVMFNYDGMILPW